MMVANHHFENRAIKIEKLPSKIQKTVMMKVGQL